MTRKVVTVLVGVLALVGTGCGGGTDYRSQLQNDLNPWEAVTQNLTGSVSMSDPRFVAFAQQATTLSQELLQQHWPPSAESDIKTGATDLQRLAADIQAGDIEHTLSDDGQASGALQAAMAAL